MASNHHLPETQEIFTEEDTEPFYSDNPLPNVWAKLHYKIQKKTIYFGKFLTKTLFYMFFDVFLLNSEMRKNKAWFGRDSAGNDTNNLEEFVFDQENFSSNYLERISKCHFIIEKDGSHATDENDSRKENPSLNPAVLQVYGRNGVYVNDMKLNLGERMILSHNDVIKLTKKVEFFRFQYESVPALVSSLPKELLTKYFVGNQIGHGGCGVIRLVHDIHTLQKYAMKIIRKENNPMLRNQKEYNMKILNEVKIMSKYDWCE